MGVKWVLLLLEGPVQSFNFLVLIQCSHPQLHSFFVTNPPSNTVYHLASLFYSLHQWCALSSQCCYVLPFGFTSHCLKWPQVKFPTRYIFLISFMCLKLQWFLLDWVCNCLIQWLNYSVAHPQLHSSFLTNPAWNTAYHLLVKKPKYTSCRATISSIYFIIPVIP